MKIVVTDWADLSGVRKVDDKEAALYEPAYVYPLEVETELLAVIEARQELKKAFNDSMSLVYQFRNKLIRENKL